MTETTQDRTACQLCGLFAGTSKCLIAEAAITLVQNPRALLQLYQKLADPLVH